MTSGRHRDPTKPPALKKYKCDICGKAFSRSNTLVTHKVSKIIAPDRDLHRTLADPRGTPGARPPKGPDSFVLTYNFFQNVTISGVGVPLRGWRPSCGKSWIRHCEVKVMNFRNNRNISQHVLISRQDALHFNTLKGKKLQQRY